MDLSVTKSSKLSSTSVPSLKQLSIEDSARKSVDRKNSITKGDLEIAAPKGSYLLCASLTTLVGKIHTLPIGGRGDGA